jgi:hypothetical protein
VENGMDGNEQLILDRLDPLFLSSKTKLMVGYLKKEMLLKV